MKRCNANEIDDKRFAKLSLLTQYPSLARMSLMTSSLVSYMQCKEPAHTASCPFPSPLVDNRNEAEKPSYKYPVIQSARGASPGAPNEGKNIEVETEGDERLGAGSAFITYPVWLGSAVATVVMHIFEYVVSSASVNPSKTMM